MSQLTPNRINMNGTVPTLVVPMLETTGPESDSRYRSLRDTIVSGTTLTIELGRLGVYADVLQTICDFLDSARGSHTQNTTSGRPAPALAPATIEGMRNRFFPLPPLHHKLTYRQDHL
jgi:hypothetical protein